MKIFFLLLSLFQLFYFTSSSLNNNGLKGKDFFRKDYEYIESKQRFYKFHKVHRNWLGAKMRCALEGAFLWYPEDQEEVDLMLAFWKERQPSLLKLHVGISDLLIDGKWETVDGKPRQDVWNKWAPGEPKGAFEGEDCAVIRRDLDTPGEVDLLVESCGSSKSFICTKTLASLDWNYHCNMPDKRYIFNPELGRCYKFHSTPLSWNKAYNACAAEESYLAVINSEKEKDLLVKSIANALTQQYPWNNVDIIQVHLGFHNQFGEGWQTITGIPLHESGYMVWGHNQPDGGDDELCGAMFFDGLLNDLGCEKQAFFICEHNINSQ